ncbi:methyl-accepting chemotaxis protein [Anaerocolumna cellulosilytica]|uniref:Methyl-accepting chemotaxis protein n=1 Tax=Anaerocolumna cellulosilytica TaxID=433286 RepID=A0A6S6R4Y8_9FIRM|nr:methyl-accepting chemotaxis protein [Anaerocolumna cellulosilytica]MBB5196398.1 methyl-accepting chemotaxis protein [Anaerocolumna cellulosilytica]BCJ94480.1 methyl-accepting chemotaxis protein [Anaerocolumna cellulosilytica]
MKSIKTKLLVLVLSLVACVILGISAIAVITASNSLLDTAEVTMESMVTQGVHVVSSRLEWQKSVLETIATNDYWLDDTLSLEQKFIKSQKYISNNKYIKLGYSDLRGNIQFSNGTSGEISDRDYFIKAAEGETYGSTPFMSRTEGIMVVVYSTPVKRNGTIVGVLTATKDSAEISNIVNDITFGETGKAFMLEGTGIKIAHYDNELIQNQDNDLVNVEEDPSLKELVKLEERMISGEVGSGSYTYKGQEKFLVFSPVDGTNWSLAVAVEKSELLSELNELILRIVVTSSIFLIIAFVLVVFITNSIIRRIKLAIRYIEPVASGDFSVPISEKHLMIKDEIGQMIKAIHTMQQSVKSMLKLVTSNSAEIDADAQSLSAVSEELSAASNVMSNSIQEVARGTVSQSESLATVTESLSVFAGNINQIAKDVESIDTNAKEIRQLSNNSNEKIHSLADSVVATNSSFQRFEKGMESLGANLDKINEITNLINSISEQTNLLSLNAAIEAARAGESGKGFAVVADEIRKLAEQSRESSVNISALIADIQGENTTMITATDMISKEITQQTDIIHETLDSFQIIVKAVEEVLPKIDTVNNATYKINQEKDEILSRVEDLSAISQETSAASEEITASTEEIASSSEDVANSAANLGLRTKEMLMEVEKFKL